MRCFAEFFPCLPQSGKALPRAAAPLDVRELRPKDTKSASQDVDLSKQRYGVGVSWEAGARRVDVDLQCVVVDARGAIIDCAYYNNMKAARAITHSGDEAIGKPRHIGEMVWANMRKLPADVSLLVFVVAAYAGGSLQDVVNGRLHIMEEREDQEIAIFALERSAGAVDVVAAIFREQSGSWKLRMIDLPAERGKHFMDILPLLSRVIRSFIPQAPDGQKVAFAMEKGSVLDLPQDMDKITVGLGWDVRSGECDLDVSAVLLDVNGEVLDSVFFGRLESIEHGIQHSGDNLTGEGEGDDEQIHVDFRRIGAKVKQIAFVVNIYTKGRTFAQVANPYCRVVNEATHMEMCRYALHDAGQESGLIIARIAREVGDRWGFHALGLPSRGSMYKDCIPHIQQISGMKTSTLLQRGGTAEGLGR